jgi:ABC-type polysaccharide/polyol phosphate transport system ATPase subunit
MGDPALVFEGVSKTFRMRNRSDALRDAIPRTFLRLIGRGGPKPKRFTALDEVSFTAERGEVLGVVGANGAGKSTSLRLAASVYPPDGGNVVMNGRVSALIELSAGFHPDLSGRENIYLAGALQGLGRREIQEVFDDIAAFADIGEYLESPVRTYSSGMAVRLGFAVAAHVPAEVMLVDEVLAVGDMEFRAKCLRRMAQRREEGAAVLFVSHNLTIIEQFCDRVIFLHHGQIQADGPPRETLAVYRKHVAEDARVTSVRESASPRLRRGTGTVRLEDVKLTGTADGAATTGGKLRLTASWQADQRVDRPVFGLQIHSVEGVLCGKVSSEGRADAPDRLEGRGTVEFQFPALPLLPGHYEVTVSVWEENGLVPFDLHQCLYPLTVTGDELPGTDGLVPLEVSIRVEGG